VAWDRSLAAHGVTMTLKAILCQRLSKYVSNLVFGVNREYLDKSLVHMLAKMMIANIDVVLKYLAVYIRLVTNDLEFLLPHFL
jgi:hypothetical protein